MIERQANEMSIFQKRILNLQILFFPPQNWVCLFILMFLKNRVRRSYSRDRITKRKYSILIWTFAHHSRSSVFLLVIQFLLYNLRTQFFKILRINKLCFVGKKIRICRFRIRFWKIRSSWNMEFDMNCWTWTIRWNSKLSRLSYCPHFKPCPHLSESLLKKVVPIFTRF